MNEQTRNIILHNAVMVTISFLFMIYFKIVQNNPELQQQIIDYSFVIPIGQILAFEGYLGYVIVLTARKLKENKKLERNLSNVFTLSMRMFHRITSQIIDLITIVITVQAFFIYSSVNPSPKILNLLNISDAYFIIFVPTLGIITYYLIFKRKLEYREKN